MEIREIRDGVVARTFAFSDEELAASEMPEELSALLSSLVKKWGDENLHALLDYVYFDTEPMENAQRGEVLDFSRLRPLQRMPAPKFDEIALKKIRAKIRERVRTLNLSREGVHIPVVDVASDRAWDDEHTPVRLIQGASVR